MLVNGNFRRMDKHDEIENQIHSNTIKNVRNYDLYSQKEIKESLNTIENISTQFSLWINDLEIQVNDAMSSRSKEIKLEGFNLNRENSSSGCRFSFGKIFNKFEKLIIEDDELEIDKEVEKYLKENKRAANKRRKNFSLEDERNFIKKKAKENISKQIKPNDNISNMINVTDLNLTEIETRINSAGENIFGEYFASINFENTEHVTEPPSENNLNSIFDTRQNSYFLTNPHNGLKEVIEEMPSKEEENFKFSLSFIEKKDSNVDMKEERKSKSNTYQDDFVNNSEYFVDYKEPILEFNLESLSVVKSIEEKCSDPISKLNNLNSDDLIASHHANNFNALEAVEKVFKDDIYFAEANLNVVVNNKGQMDRIDKLDLNVNKNEVVPHSLQTNISTNPYNTIKLERISLKPASIVNDVNESKENKIIFKSSNIKMNMNSNLNANKHINNNAYSNAAVTYLNQDGIISSNKDIFNSKPNNADFTFFKEKPNNNTNTHTSCDKIAIAIDVSNKSQVNSANVITNSNEANANEQTNNLNSNFLKDKDNLFNILFNYNESFSNIEESPAVEKWNPNKLESTSKKLGTFKNNLNNANIFQNMSENNSKTKIVLNKVFKDTEELGNIDIKQNFFKSSKQSKQIITNNIPSIQANQTSNTKNNLSNSQNNFNFSKTKINGNSSQNFDSDKKFNIMNNITKTLSKKLIDPGYEITDQSCSSSDDKKDSDSDDKANGTPMFKTLKIPKHIPKWANDKKYLNERVFYQKSKMDYKVIFGSCKIDDLNLNLIFTNSKKEYNQPRGDSADWKLDNTISSHQHEDKNIEGGNYRNYYNSIDMNLSNNKSTCGANRKLLEVFNEINY